MSRIVWGFTIVLIAGNFCGTVHASATFGTIHALRQPDGQSVSVRIWGDEFYQVVESLDGYTLVRDPATLTICYAQLSDDRTELIPTGIPLDAIQKSTLALKPHIRISTQAAQNIVATARAEHETRLAKGGTDKAQPQSKLFSSGKARGLTILIDFPDARGTIPPSEIERMCNTPGYNGYGNHGSVRDYFLDVSEGKLTYTNYVPTAYYTVQNSKAYYDNPNNCGYGQASRIQEMILEALDGLERQGFDFSGFDGNGDGAIDALNVLYTGNTTSGWGCGLWPHTGTVNFAADNVRTNRYHLSNLGDEPFMGTFCHETGHVLLGWPDLYDYDFDSYGVGQFCLMGLGDFPNNPVEPCAYLKHITGWSMTELLLWPGNYSLAAGSNHIYMIPHPSYMGEYFLLENRLQQDRDEKLPDSGLTVWHVDRITGNQNYQQHTEAKHYQVALLQADGRFDLESRRNTGDSTDLFGAPEYTTWNSSTQPNSHWWDDYGSGAKIFNIGPPGPTIAFSFATEPYTTPVNINTPENFPDEKFRHVVEEFMEVVPGGFFTKERAAAVSRIKKILDCPGLSIGSLQGIAFLSGLTSLNCSNNKLSSLDLFGNPDLVWLECYDNLLETLNVSACTILSVLDCRNNKLTVLDTTRLTQLERIFCQNNQIQSLQLRGKILLKEVECDFNKLTALDASQCPVLKRISCSINKIAALDLSGDATLSELNCRDNLIQSLKLNGCVSLLNLNCVNNKIQVINVSSSHSLKTIDCSINALRELVLPHTDSLTRINCTQNNLTELDASGCSQLVELDCSNNQIQSLLLEGCILLESLYCDNNNITNLDIPSRDTINTIDCNNNRITGIILAGSPNLQVVNCRDNHIRNLDLRDCPALLELDCQRNSIIKLDISSSNELRTLLCMANQLSELNVPDKPKLTRFECNENPLRYVNVSRDTLLARLEFNDIPLENLDISYCTRLTSLSCINTNLQGINLVGTTSLLYLSLSNNHLTSLDVTPCTQLIDLDCSGNQIESLRVAGIKGLNCSKNRLNQIDLSNCVGLMAFYCSQNTITALDLNLFEKLSTLDCSQNRLTYLTFPFGRRLSKINCNRNLLTTLDISTLSRVESFDCSYNLLNKIAYVNNMTISTIFCNNNQFERVWDIPLVASVKAADIRNNLLDYDDRHDIEIILARIGEAHFLSNGALSSGLLYSPQTGIDPYRIGNLDENSPIAIPDSNFRAALEKELGISPGTPITIAMANKYYYGFNLSNCGIRDLTGLSYFHSIQDLNCSGNLIEILDLDLLQNLGRLNCSNNLIQSLDVSKLLNLVILDCSNNRIQNLTVSGLPLLQTLDCSMNALDVFDVTQCSFLNTIACSKNRLKHLSINPSSYVNTIDCNHNELQSIVLNDTSAITRLDCSYNRISTIDWLLNYHSLTYLNLQGNLIFEVHNLVNMYYQNLDIRDNLLDCGDWEDVKTIQNRFNDPVYDEYGNLKYGFLFSPQSGLDPYDCDNSPVPTPTPTPPETAIEDWIVR